MPAGGWPSLTYPLSGRNSFWTADKLLFLPMRSRSEECDDPGSVHDKFKFLKEPVRLRGFEILAGN